MILTQEERNRFADYLEQDANDSELIIEQMKKLNHEIMVKHILIEVAAERLIIKKLRVTVDG